MTQIFENPQQFYHHLETKLNSYDSLSDPVKKNLLLGSVHSIKYLLESQSLLSEKIYKLIHTLNTHHPSWGHKLFEFYTILEAADTTPEELNKILLDEICNNKEQT